MRQLFILITIVFSICGQAFAEEGLPQAQGRLTWDRSLTQFSGVIGFELSSDASPARKIDFSLYPNRYLQAAAWSNRESLESNTRAEGSDDATFLRRRASLIVSESHIETFTPHRCSEVLADPDNFQPQERTRVNVSFNRFETIANVALPAFEKIRGCRILVINFLFNPPYSIGNFGVVNANEMHFSGPIFPFPRDSFFNTQVHFKNLNAVCAQCETSPNGSVLKFRSFPTPIHFFSKPPNRLKTRLWNRDVVVLQLSSESVTEEILETLQDIERVYPFRKLIGEKKRPPFFVMEGLLTDKLVLRHPAEVQIGTGFHKITALFKNYHDAALTRGVLTEILTENINDRYPPATPEILRRNTALGRWLADVLMRRHHKGLDTIRNISHRLMFIPLFNDIFRGKALVNNDVFLGAEETETALDSKPADVLSPTFNGTEIQTRVSWCFEKPTVALLDKDMDDVITQRKPIEKWIDELSVLRSPKCNRSLNDILTNKSIIESIEINVSEHNPFSSTLEFRRAPHESQPYSLFRMDEDLRANDKLVLRYGLRDQAEDGGTFKTYETNTTNETKIFRTNIPESNLQAEVLGPTTDSSDDLHRYPRQREFLISGLKLRYNSVEKNIDGQTGVMWRYRGDKYERVFSLNLLRDKGIFYFEPNMMGTLLLSDEFEIQNDRFIQSIPFGIGLPVTLGAKPELWVSAQTGFSDANTSLLAPDGYSVTLKASQTVYRKDNPRPAFKIESGYTVFAPIAKLLTLVPSFVIGRSTEALDVGNTFAPGVASDLLFASNYIASNVELRGVISHHLRISIGNMVTVEHVTFFTGHNFTADIGELDDSPPQMPSVQSVQAGFRVFGTFFGAKDQMISLAMSRGLTSRPNNVFSLAIGR